MQSNLSTLLLSRCFTSQVSNPVNSSGSYVLRSFSLDELMRFGWIKAFPAAFSSFLVTSECSVLEVSGTWQVLCHNFIGSQTWSLLIHAFLNFTLHRFFCKVVKTPSSLSSCSFTDSTQTLGTASLKLLPYRGRSEANINDIKGLIPFFEKLWSYHLSQTRRF